MEINLNTTIGELLTGKLISVRTYHVCNSNRLYTVEEIKHFHDTTPHSFALLPHCGKKSAFELCSIIKNIQSKVTEVDKFEIVNQIIRQTFIDEYELFVNDPSVDSVMVTLFLTKFPNPSSLFQECVYSFMAVSTHLWASNRQAKKKPQNLYQVPEPGSVLKRLC